MNKGSYLDIVFVVAIALVMGISVVVSQFMLTNLNEGIENEHFTEIANKGEVAFQTFDMAIPFLMMGTFIVSIILAFFVRTHPILFVMSFLVMLILVVVTAQFSNLWVEFTKYSGFTPIVNDMPMLFWTLKNLPLLMLVFLVVLGIVQYSGSSGGGYAV